MAIYKRDIADINLETGNIHRSFLNHSIGYMDQKADHFGIRVFRNGEPVDLTGVSVQGVFMPPQGSPIAITSGNIVSGNVAEVVLPQACYNYDGQFCLSIKLVDSTNSVTGTMRIVDGMVDNTHASGTVAPTSAVPTYQEILSTYDAMVAATAAANGAIAATYSSSSTYAVGDYCIHDGGLYRCTTAITTGEAWTAGHWTAAKIGPDVSDLKSALISEFINGNAFDILAFINKYDFSMRSVDYTWNADKTAITVSGKATGGNSVLSLGTGYANPDRLPEWTKPGETYRVKYSATNVFLQVLCYKNTVLTSELIKTKTNGEFTIPSDATGVVIRLFVESGTTVNETVSPKIFTVVPTNEELFDNGYYSRGFVAVNTDIDTLKQPGCYLLGVGTYTHHPNPGSATALLVFKSTDSVITQLAIDVAKRTISQRVSLSGVFPSTWTVTDFPNNGTVPSDTDLDTIKEHGIWFLNSSNNYTHSPFSSVFGGMMLVFKYNDNNVLQIVAKANTGEVYFRSSLLGNFPATWGMNGTVYNNTYTTENYENTYNITCSPTITADTNNYLASTGDTTDRTGDIQTMLNNTGVCHLGPGLFYTTGIEVPSLGSLIGSGKKTQLILASSVSSGYAVKLKTDSTVKDLYIRGATSNITPSSTVRTRHGILFEGTADAASSPTTFYHSYITGCLIRNFTGGGITCYNTGLSPETALVISDCQIENCDAGVNVAYFSEFHRWTNITANGCYYGCICNGGNNNFANCDFSMNKMALLIDNSTNQSRNNSHGTFSACSFHHSDNTYSGGAVVSVGTGIKILKATAGEIFSGCQIGYGDIEIDESIGIRFDGCNILSKVAMEVTDSSLVVFSDCTFIDTTNNPLTQSGNTTLKFHDCYTRNGAVFDPMS